MPTDKFGSKYEHLTTRSLMAVATMAADAALAHDEATEAEVSPTTALATAVAAQLVLKQTVDALAWQVAFGVTTVPRGPAAGQARLPGVK